MNKHIIKTAFAALLALPLVSSCELDQYPTGSLENGQSWETFDRAKKQYIGLQSYMRAVSGGSNAYTSDIQSDLFNARQGAIDLTRCHEWNFTNTDGIGSGLWSTNFAMVKQAHEILAHIDAFDVKEPKNGQQAMQKVQVNFYKAASYFSIAWAYSNMVVRFCKDYEPSTAAETLGMPLVYKSDDVTTKPSRSTLAQTDTFIVNRIDSAYKYFDKAEELQDEYSNLLTAAKISQINIDGTSGSDYTTAAGEAGRDALKALEARYDLYSHRFDRAIELGKEMVDKYPLTSGSKELQKLWVLDTGSEIIFQPTQTKDELATSYSTIWVNYDIRSSAAEGTQLLGANPYYFPTKGLINLFEDTDYRKDIYFNNPYYDALPCSNDKQTEAGTQFWKFPGNQNLWKNNYEWYSKIYNMSKAFRSAEDCLIVAEASLRKANPDEATALEYLNMLREARGASTLSSTGEQLVKDMQDEWTREFVGEGFRLDCLKRWHMGFTRMTPQEFSTNMLQTGDHYTTLKVSADDPRFVWEIPLQDLQANPNMQKNW